MTWVPRGGGSQEGTTGDLLSHQPEFLGTPLNYYELWESHQVSPRVRGEGHHEALNLGLCIHAVWSRHILGFQAAGHDCSLLL